MNEIFEMCRSISTTTRSFPLLQSKTGPFGAGSLRYCEARQNTGCMWYIFTLHLVAFCKSGSDLRGEMKLICISHDLVWRCCFCAIPTFLLKSLALEGSFPSNSCETDSIIM